MPKKTKPSTPSPNPEKPKRNPRGRTPGEGRFKPTPEQRQLVLQAVGFQIPQDQICQLILHQDTKLPIGETTLKKHFVDELRRGAANTKVLHAMALWKQVQAGHVTAMIWWDKTRNKIGMGLKGYDKDTPDPTATAPIDEPEVDIVILARRVAFTLAMGRAKMTRAETTALKPPQKADPKPK